MNKEICICGHDKSYHTFWKNNIGEGYYECNKIIDKKETKCICPLFNKK